MNASGLDPATDTESYWRSFYSGLEAPTFPSQFAVFVKSWLGKETPAILELGAGNGRDARFFLEQGHHLVAFDQVIGDELQSVVESSDHAVAISGSIEETTTEAPAGLGQQPIVVYSRFFQHAIPETIEDQMLANLASWLPAGTFVFFEFRVSGDQVLPKTFDGHYRRFQGVEEVCQRVAGHGFDQHYVVSGTGFARYGEEDPLVGRFVFKKTDCSWPR